jgi:excisionase family DNA binding protein
VTTKQAADALGVAVSTVQKWVELGRLASWKTPGGHRRILMKAVRELLQPDQPDPAEIAISSEINEVSPVICAQSNPYRTDEMQRLTATRATGLLDTPAHHAYDRIVRMAALVADMPISLISLLDENRQWFKSRVGLSITETPRSWAFCNYTILDEKILIVEDALLDKRFADNPLVTGSESIRFYAGVPLVDKNACRLGSLCVLDRVPRKLTHEQTWALTELAVLVSEEIQRATCMRQ